MKDFNALLREQGAEAVRTALRAGKEFLRGGLPAYYPAPVEPREAALQRQRELIADTIANAVLRAGVLREIRHRVKDEVAEAIEQLTSIDGESCCA